MSISYSQAVQFAQQAGFSGGSQYIIAAISQAESGLNPSATNCNNPGGTCDRGILQINNYWHSEVSDSCAYNPVCAFQQAFRISNNGTSFQPWTTYTSGVYKQYVQSGSSNTTSTNTSTNQTPSSNCAPWDVPCIVNSIYSSDMVRKAGLMFVAIIVVVIGLVLVFR